MIIETREAEYDTLLPEQQISQFLRFCRAVTARSNNNTLEIAKKDDETQDLLHFAELHNNLNCREGNEVYKKLRAVRRERRQLRNENELLSPALEWINANGAALKALEKALGATRTRADVIAKRQYMTKTNTLEDLVTCF